MRPSRRLALAIGSCALAVLPTPTADAVGKCEPAGEHTGLFFHSNRPWQTAEGELVEDPDSHQVYRAHGLVGGAVEPVTGFHGWTVEWLDKDPGSERLVISHTPLEAVGLPFENTRLAVLDLEAPLPLQDPAGPGVEVLLDVLDPDANPRTLVPWVFQDVPAVFASVYHPVFDPTPGTNRVAFAGKRTVVGAPLTKSKGNLFLLDLDDGELHHLAGDWGTMAVDPRFRADGWIVYVRVPEGALLWDTEIWALDPDEPSHAVQLRRGTGLAVGDPAPDPWGTRVAFEQNDVVGWGLLGQWSAHVMTPDGEVLAQDSVLHPQLDGVLARITTVPVWWDGCTLVAYASNWVQPEAGLGFWTPYRIVQFAAEAPNGPLRTLDLASVPGYGDELPVPF